MLKFTKHLHESLNQTASCNSQFQHDNYSGISDQFDRWWWNHHCNDFILSHTLTLVASAKKSEFAKFEAFW